MSEPRVPLEDNRSARLREAQELEAEFEAHLAHRVDDLVEEGHEPSEARRVALEEFGDQDRLKKESQEVRARARARLARTSRLEALWQDVAYSLRAVGRRPGFAFAALASLMLGIGGTATIVSVVDAVALTPLPFDEPDRVVYLEMLTPEGARFAVAEAGFLDWEDQATSFEEMAAYSGGGATLRSPGQPRSIVRGYLSHSFLDVLGREPVIGRMFTEGEDLPGAPAPVALLSYDMWRSEFAADPAVIGAELDMDGVRHEVIGVMPEDLDIVSPGAPVFTPLGASPQADRGEHYLEVVGRLGEDVDMAAATVELKEVQRGLSQRYTEDAGWGAVIHESDYILIGDSTETAGRILLVAAAMLLIMSCVNVSNLLMIRATERRGEMGLRAALGASRSRLVGQLFTESALLAGVGGVIGILFAAAALPVVRSLGEARIPRLDDAELQGLALLVALASVAAATLACGLAPVAQLRTTALASAAGSGRVSDAGRGIRSLLVGVQVGITVILLVGTGLLTRSFIELSRVDPGFDPEGTLAVRIDMPDQSFTWGERAEIFPQLRQAVASLPGVVAVGATAVDPFSGISLANFVARVDRMPDRAADFTPIHWRTVTPGFIEAMGMELREGRTLRESDDFGGRAPIVIGESLARALFGTESAIGRTLVWGDPDGSRLEVVGVVEDLRDVALADEAFPMVYRPHRQIPWAVMTLVARIQGDPATVAAGIRDRIGEAVPGLPVAEIRSLEENVRGAVAEPRFNLQLLASFAVVGLLLAIVGVYGLTAFDVRRRFREIGIRLSLGAEPTQIRTMFLRERMVLTSIALVAGAAVAWWLTRWIESELYGVTARDPITWIGVVLIVLAVSAAATYLPARRATRIQPSDVLTVE